MKSIGAWKIYCTKRIFYELLEITCTHGSGRYLAGLLVKQSIVHSYVNPNP